MKKRLFALAGALLLLASGNISAEAMQALTSRLFAVLTCGACGFGMGATSQHHGE